MLNIAFVLLNHLLLFVSYFLSPFKGKVQKDLPSINNSKLWDFVAFKLVLFLLPSIQIYGSFENEHHHNPGNYENQQPSSQWEGQARLRALQEILPPEDFCYVA